MHQRRADVGDIDARSDMGPGIAEGELAMVHFIINWQTRWLVRSIDTDQPKVTLLAMTTGLLSAVEPGSHSWVQVIIKRFIQGRMDYLTQCTPDLRHDMS